MPLDWWNLLHWEPSPDQLQRFTRLYETLMRINQSVNLTRLTHGQEFWEKHIWDSLIGIQPWLSPDHPFACGSDLPLIHAAIDIGTGGGFPGLPVAIVRPQWQVTLLDSIQKKVTCLADLVKQLQMPHVHPHCDRAEVLGHHPDHRSHYDLALIRAVAHPVACAEYCLPLLNLTGIAVLYRGQWTLAEEHHLSLALQQLGGELVEIVPLQTPYTASQRHCIYLRKTQPTPSHYPRRPGVPVRKPLA